MEVFTEFLQRINIPPHRERTEEVLTWVKETFPQLEPVLKWNQPMFTDHGTFIIGFSVSKNISLLPQKGTRFPSLKMILSKLGMTMRKKLFVFHGLAQ